MHETMVFFEPCFQPMPETTEPRIRRYAIYEIADPQSYRGEYRKISIHAALLDSSSVSGSIYSKGLREPPLRLGAS